MLRRALRHPTTQAVLARLLGLYLRLVFATTRWRVEGEGHLRAAAEAGPILAAFWHERLPLMPAAWLTSARVVPGLAAKQARVLVSRHRDGRFIGEVCRPFRMEMVHGSTNRGGAAGMRVLLRLLAAGEVVVITPDGPRGPRRIAAPGVAQLAALSGLAVLPCAARSSRGITLRSWDRMVLPLPFARGVIAFGPLVPVAREAPEAALPAIEAALSAACDAADAGALGRRLGAVPAMRAG
ncbi:lysophospholipid acyltransferase family protein [Siccirubricoccus phaeus]|uniref:lysophospholipid acyltransferase family protein n=1 Tax=Siccirubricoccus phaeus TaxID=2595053 RepID=UPI0011F10D53|nr:lysophospholipid acyltransferase family protein [Siccirubricoccus phaeus]